MRKSILENNVILEDSKEFQAGVRAAEKAINNGANEDNIYHKIEIPKYILKSNHEDVHDAFHMAIGYFLNLNK